MFCGKGAGLSYVSSTADYVDFCSRDTWSILWIEDILKQLGYEMDGKLCVYWSPPWKEICEGLVCIQRDADIVQMINAAESHKTLDLFVDHGGFLNICRPEAISNGATSGASAGSSAVGPSTAGAGPGPSAVGPVTAGTSAAGPSATHVGSSRRTVAETEDMCPGEEEGEVRTHGPAPQESSFVEAAGESIPQSRVRVSTSTSRGRLRRRGGGRITTHIDATEQPSTGRGIGKRRKRQQTGENTSGTSQLEDGQRDSGIERGGTGDVVPDLNEDVVPEHV